MPSLGEAPSGGAGAFGYFGLFKVTRCKSETVSSRYRRNGYVPRQTRHKSETASNHTRSNGYVPQEDRTLRLYGRYAPEREQAPSPQKNSPTHTFVEACSKL